MPVLEADDYGGEGPGRVNGLLNGPFGLMLKALDGLRKNEVYMCTGSSPDYALWGELMSTCALNNGAAGAVVDGYSRDTRGILALGFPVFRGSWVGLVVEIDHLPTPCASSGRHSLTAELLAAHCDSSDKRYRIKPPRT